jgi:hypothetical protein
MGRKEEYIQEMREKIESELEYLDIKPYSKNLIEIRLRCVASKYGTAEANKLLGDIGLELYGWKKERVERKTNKTERGKQ